MGIKRITKKLVPQLEDIDAAVLMVNAVDPQYATLAVFQSAVDNIPNFIVVNKCDLVDAAKTDEILSKIKYKNTILTSMKNDVGLDDIRFRLSNLKRNSKIAILGVFNSGKTSLINKLTGSNEPVGDLPGTTLELTRHSFNGLTLIDTIGQVTDVSKPLMVSIDLEGCSTVNEKLTKCIKEDSSAVQSLLDQNLFNINNLEQAVELIIKQVKKGGKVVTCGAGASALIAMQMGGQGFETGLPVMVFTNNFATAQPVSFAKGSEEDELSMSEYFAQAIQPNDVVIGISASGGTAFVYRLLQLARDRGVKTIAITENSDTPLGKAADIIIKSNSKPEGPSSSKIQVTHLVIGHALMITIADERGIDAEKAVQYMMPNKLPNKLMGIK